MECILSHFSHSQTNKVLRPHTTTPPDSLRRYNSPRAPYHLQPTTPHRSPATRRSLLRSPAPITAGLAAASRRWHDHGLAVVVSPTDRFCLDQVAQFLRERPARAAVLGLWSVMSLNTSPRLLLLVRYDTSLRYYYVTLMLRLSKILTLSYATA